MLLYRKIIWPVTIVGFSLILATPAAAATQIQSSAYDLRISLTLLNALTVGINPLAEAAGTAPAAYTNSDQVASLDQTLNLGVLSLLGVQERVTTGVLTAAAQSPYPASQTGSAQAQVNNLSALLGTVFLTDFSNLLGIGADTIVSRSSVSATGGIATATGFTSLEGLNLTGSLLGGATIDGALYVNPDPNTVLFSLGLLGQETLKIVLNEQVDTSNGTSSASISTNAIHIILRGVQLTSNPNSLLSGDITIGHSEAIITDAMNAVPEPAVWAQLIAGFALTGALARRRRLRAATA